STYPDSLWAGATRDGVVYGIPAFMFVDWMYYRVDWLEEAGIAAPPTTWEEFEAAAIAMTDPAQGRYGFGLRGGDGGQDIVVSVIESCGGLSYDETGAPSIDPAKATEAIAFFAGLATEHNAAPPSAPNDSYRQVMEAFRTGQTGMVLHHTGSLKEITEALGGAVMTAPRPAGPAAPVARVSPLYNGMMKADNADAAWAWLTFWAEPDVEIGFLEDTGYFPPTTAAAEDERVTGNPYYAAAIETVGFGGLPPAFPGYPGWASTSVLPSFQQVLNGQATPEQAVEQMAAGLSEATG
ncbi:MAG TPA: extracellular solute-binding protein, partial [Thermomicrobiales bacterium]|nr:extracellular solute-binding protein [Thermomicrobiales bacterium]